MPSPETPSAPSNEAHQWQRVTDAGIKKVRAAFLLATCKHEQQCTSRSVHQSVMFQQWCYESSSVACLHSFSLAGASLFHASLSVRLRVYSTRGNNPSKL
eukprot:1178908-Prorocentrum_minimum.AAC.4